MASSGRKPIMRNNRLPVACMYGISSVGELFSEDFPRSSVSVAYRVEQRLRQCTHFGERRDVTLRGPSLFRCRASLCFSLVFISDWLSSLLLIFRIPLLLLPAVSKSSTYTPMSKRLRLLHSRWIEARSLENLHDRYANARIDVNPTAD